MDRASTEEPPSVLCPCQAAGYSYKQTSDKRDRSSTPIRKNNLGISGVERLWTPVTGILIVGLQHH